VDQGSRLSRIALHSTLGMALLPVLAIAAPLQAQSPQSLLSGSQEQSARAELRDDYILRTPDVGFSFDDWETSTPWAGERATPATAAPAETLPLDPSGIVSESCAPAAPFAVWFSVPERLPQSVGPQPELVAEGDKLGEDSNPLSVEMIRPPKPPELNRNIYYKNKFEFGLDIGWLPINIPFAFDVFLGDGYTMTPLKYTLVPIIASVRWQMDDVGGPSILRGNWDLSFSGSVTAIPRGPETRYFSYIMGIRRNFVQRNWKVAPYFDGRLGLGNIDAKGPKGVAWAQGQNFTFTLNMGSGLRYSFNPRYSISAGINYMHISNLYLSEPRYGNYGINVYGPMFGIDVRLGKHQRGGSQ
jgi:hypothetical protein